MNQPGWSSDDGESVHVKSTNNEYIQYPRSILILNTRLSDSFSNKLNLEEGPLHHFEEEEAEGETLVYSEDGKVVINSVSMQIEKVENPNNEENLSSSDFEGDDKTPGGRYFGGSSGGPKCFNCGQFGHIVKECPESNGLPCFLCGGTDHQKNACPEEICYNCGRTGHHSRECHLPRKRRLHPSERCNRCDLPGHIQRDCSLEWRRYVFVREPTDHEVQRAINLLDIYCYNCASTSHFGDECVNRRRMEWSVFHEPAAEFLRLAAYRSNDRTHRKPSEIATPRSRYHDHPTYHQSQAYTDSTTLSKRHQHWDNSNRDERNYHYHHHHHHQQEVAYSTNHHDRNSRNYSRPHHGDDHYKASTRRTYDQRDRVNRSYGSNWASNPANPRNNGNYRSTPSSYPEQFQDDTKYYSSGDGTFHSSRGSSTFRGSYRR